MKRWQKDILYGVVLLIVSALMMRDLSGMNEAVIPYKNAEAGIYSRVWLTLLMILSAAMIIRALVRRNAEKSESTLNVTSIGTIAALAVYLLLMKPLGYVISTVIFLTILMTFYAYKSNKFKTPEGVTIGVTSIAKKIGLNVVVSIAVAVATYLLFTKMVGVMLPKFPM